MIGRLMVVGLDMVYLGWRVLAEMGDKESGVDVDVDIK